MTARKEDVLLAFNSAVFMACEVAHLIRDPEERGYWLGLAQGMRDVLKVLAPCPVLPRSKMKEFEEASNRSTRTYCETFIYNKYMYPNPNEED